MRQKRIYFHTTNGLEECNKGFTFIENIHSAFVITLICGCLSSKAYGLKCVFPWKKVIFLIDPVFSLGLNIKLLKMAVHFKFKGNVCCFNPTCSWRLLSFFLIIEYRCILSQKRIAFASLHGEYHWRAVKIKSL